MARLTRALRWIVPAYLLGAAVYELTLAIDGRTDNCTRSTVPRSSSENLSRSIPSGRREWAIVSLAPAAAVFVVARFYAYDPYYEPTLRRYSDNGATPPAWVWLVTAAAVVAGVLAWRVPRAGAVATAIVLVALTATTALLGTN